jgi:hypothetical protein
MSVSLWILRTISFIEMNCRKYQNTHVVFNKFLSWYLWHLWDNVEKYRWTGQATGGNIIWHMRFACWITKATDTYTHTHTQNMWYSLLLHATMVSQKRLNIAFIRSLPNLLYYSFIFLSDVIRIIYLAFHIFIARSEFLLAFRRNSVIFTVHNVEKYVSIVSVTW